MNYIWISLFFIISFGICLGAEVPGQKVPTEWKTCSSDWDCGATEVGCYFWVIANKKYFKKVQENIGSQACLASCPPGPKPATACIDRVCVDKWRACSQNSDCTATEINCTLSKYANWEPGNKKFIKKIEMSEQKYRESLWKYSCPASFDPGPKPVPD